MPLSSDCVQGSQPTVKLDPRGPVDVQRKVRASSGLGGGSFGKDPRSAASAT